jgi:hypothetical protein
LGDKSTDKLKSAGYQTPLQLIAEYFKLDADEAKFAAKIVEAGVDKKYADQAAEAIHQKVGKALLKQD